MITPLVLLALALQKEPDPVCSAEVRWSSNAQLGVSRAEPTIALNLFSAVSHPSSCLPAEIRLTLSYFDVNNQIVCSGVVENVATQGNYTQSTSLEIRPLNLLEFVRWTNGSRDLSLRFKRLPCKGPDGLSEVQGSDLDQAAYLRVYATILPHWGGLSNAELVLRLVP